MAYEGPYLGDDDGDREYEDGADYEDEGPGYDSGDLGDDLPEWWDESMPEDWIDVMDYDYDAFEYEEFEIGIDYGEAT